MASSHFYSTYYPQTKGKVLVGMIEEPPAPVPMKTQVATASTKFASLKDKISSFFNTMSIKKEANRACSINLLVNLELLNFLNSNYH